MEIDLDGMMKSMLLLKKKKYATQPAQQHHCKTHTHHPRLPAAAHTHRYAALMVEEKNGELITTRETKGLDLVRRDWCTLSREAGLMVLDFILAGLNREELVSKILEYLSDIAKKVKTLIIAAQQKRHRRG